MKPSHLTTPRTLSECHFTPGYMSAPPNSRSEIAHRLVPIVGGALAAAVLVLVAMGAL